MLYKIIRQASIPGFFFTYNNIFLIYYICAHRFPKKTVLYKYHVVVSLSSWVKPPGMEPVGMIPLLTGEKKLVCGLARSKVAEKKNYISLIDKREYRALIEVPSRQKKVGFIPTFKLHKLYFTFLIEFIKYIIKLH